MTKKEPTRVGNTQACVLPVGSCIKNPDRAAYVSDTLKEADVCSLRLPLYEFIDILPVGTRMYQGAVFT